MQAKLVYNHETLARWNHAKKKKYDNQRQDMLAEKDQWLKDKAKMESISKPDGQVVDLNIGGTHQMTCSIDVLLSDKGSDLEKLFSGNFKHKIIDGKVFLDRDGEVFK